MTPSAGRFCVVTPNFNMGSYLAETIDSVLANLGPGDEYFVIDGGSTDNSLEVLHRYGDRITGWVSEPDRSYADALAKGFTRSTNQLQCWIACGDLMLLDALTSARGFLVHRDVDMIFGDDLYVDEDGRIIQVTNGEASDLARAMVWGAWTPLQDACFWRRDLYQRVGGLDADIQYAADYDLFLRMSVAGRCQYVPHVFSAFRRHAGQTSHKHRLRYKEEKFAARSKIMRSNPESIAGSPLSKARYWIQTRLRARLMNTKYLPVKLEGSYALEHRSAPTCRFGVAT